MARWSVAARPPPEAFASGRREPGTIRSVTLVHSPSDMAPILLAEPAGAWQAIRVATRAEAMGLLGPALRRERMVEAVGAAFDALVRAGIGRREIASLDGADPGEIAAILSRVSDALEASPHPDTEWSALTARLGEDLLTRLCQVSPSSVARYSGGLRATPDPVANRLHHVAMVVADLAGSYNERGIRRWFDRPRPQLAGATPASLLTGTWDPDEPGPRRVAELAAVLAGAGAAT